MSNDLREELEKENVTGGTPVEDLSSGVKIKSINGFVQKYNKIIILSVIFIVVVLGLVLLIRSNSAKNEVSASKALSRIEHYYIKGEYENALFGNDSLPTVRGEKIIGLVEIVKEYASTTAGDRAALYAADSYFNIGKYSEAKGYYEKAIKSKIDVISVGGLAGSAACNEKNGNYKEAASEYSRAAELIPEDMLKMRYLYFAGLCNEKSGNKDESLKIYRTIVELNRYGEFNNLAKAGIIRLGAEIE